MERPFITMPLASIVFCLPQTLVPYSHSLNKSTQQRSTDNFDLPASDDVLAWYSADKNRVFHHYHASSAITIQDIRPRDIRFIDVDSAVCGFTSNDIRSSRPSGGLRVAFDGGHFSTRCVTSYPSFHPETVIRKIIVIYAYSKTATSTKQGPSSPTLTPEEGGVVWIDEPS